MEQRSRETELATAGQPVAVEAQIEACRREEGERRAEVETLRAVQVVAAEAMTREVTAEGGDHVGARFVREELEETTAAAEEEAPMLERAPSQRRAAQQRRSRNRLRWSSCCRTSVLSGSAGWRLWRPCGGVLRVVMQRVLAVAVGQALTRGVRTFG